jgi:hypothetical protein
MGKLWFYYSCELKMTAETHLHLQHERQWMNRDSSAEFYGMYTFSRMFPLISMGHRILSFEFLFSDICSSTFVFPVTPVTKTNIQVEKTQHSEN